MANEKHQYPIGIDLGTTNSALAFVANIKPDAKPELFPIPQWENEEQTIQDFRLPSFLWLLSKSRQKKPYAQSLLGEAKPYLVGRLAREQANNEPHEVIHSAKSWLSAGKPEQRSGRILPWGSAGEKLSPLEVQTAYLGHIKAAWNLAHPESPIHEQKVVITVPASFDELAQRLTLEASKLAGYGSVELLEEPIAAFYAWSAQAKTLPEGAKILVCDIGGGTADFSLLSWKHAHTERLRVSDHLLLGGDNIDLAITHRIAARLSSEELPRAAYNLLFAQVRKLKEKALASETEETFHLSIPLDSKNLFGRYLSASIPSSELRAWVLEDFFPHVSSDARPEKASGLQSWGLPYARDTRVTAHLAEFLEGETIDALLCVGGTLIPEILQKRLHETLSTWQEKSIQSLTLNDGDLAIAEGAARFAQLRLEPEQKSIIHSPYPRELLIEVEGLGEVCLIPRGHPRMTPFHVAIPGLQLRLGEEVRFQLEAVNARGHKTSLAPLILNLSLSKKKGLIPVRLESLVRETGVLEVTCHSEEGSVVLDFALEGSRQQISSSLGLPLNLASVTRLKEAQDAIKRTFHRETVRAAKPDKLPSEIEEIFGIPREQWTADHLRGLWIALESVMFQRNLSNDHESNWFYLAGFALRPGFGYQGDDSRMASLLRVYDESFRRVEQQPKLLTHWWILWRRLAGGLSAAFQQKLFDRYMPLFRKEKDPSPELIRLLASLERLEPSAKIQIGRQLLNQMQTSRTNLETKVWALARIASRYPVYAPASTVLAPSIVEEWGTELIALNLPSKARTSLYFAWAGRLRGDKQYDIDPEYRERFLERIDNPEWQKALREVITLDSTAQAQMLADSLPTGFVFRD